MNIFNSHVTTERQARRSRGQQAPENHRQGQPELSDRRPAAQRMDERQHFPHGQKKNGEAQPGRPPETVLEIGDFVIFRRGIERDGGRLQRHAALGAVAGMVLLDFRVHRAGINRVLQSGRRIVGHADLLLHEFAPAAFTAKIGGLARPGGA
ncbi:MAG: hypothetical protein QM796_15185 [Chthoniobacteraceae bacterium]